jgi:hypothetical protein
MNSSEGAGQGGIIVPGLWVAIGFPITLLSAPNAIPPGSQARPRRSPGPQPKYYLEK